MLSKPFKLSCFRIRLSVGEVSISCCPYLTLLTQVGSSSFARFSTASEIVPALPKIFCNYRVRISEDVFASQADPFDDPVFSGSGHRNKSHVLVATSDSALLSMFYGTLLGCSEHRGQ